MVVILGLMLIWLLRGVGVGVRMGGSTVGMGVVVGGALTGGGVLAWGWGWGEGV